MLSAKSLKAVFFKEQFQPGWLGLFVNPFYFARKGLYQEIKSLAPQIKGKVLDVGCGSKPYEALFQVSEYIGLELASPENQHKKADYFYDGAIFPFTDKTFDSVITNQVLEHVFNPDVFLSEIHRVLKDDGIVLLTVPFVWDEHEQPFDYARYSSFGLKYLLEKYQFEVIEQRKSIQDIRVIFQLLNAYLYKMTVTPNSYINLLSTLILIAPFNILGTLLANLLPRNKDLYLDNVILAKKIN